MACMRSTLGQPLGVPTDTVGRTRPPDPGGVSPGRADNRSSRAGRGPGPATSSPNEPDTAVPSSATWRRTRGGRLPSVTPSWASPARSAARLTSVGTAHAATQLPGAGAAAGRVTDHDLDVRARRSTRPSRRPRHASTGSSYSAPATASGSSRKPELLRPGQELLEVLGAGTCRRTTSAVRMRPLADGTRARITPVR